jgi:hypothetical protein
MASVQRSSATSTPASDAEPHCATYRRATTNFMLARAYEKRGELERAIEHAGNARDYLRGIAPRHADILEHIEGWLAQRER